MEIKRSGAIAPLPIETNSLESTQKPISSKGIGNVSDVFETYSRDRLANELQRRQYATGNFPKIELSSTAPALSRLTTNQLNTISEAVSQFVKETDPSQYKETASALQKAAATASAIPVVGQIIAAVLMIVAAVLMVMADIAAQQKESEAAAKEKEPETNPQVVIQRLTESLKKMSKIDDDDDRD